MKKKTKENIVLVFKILHKFIVLLIYLFIVRYSYALNLVYFIQ